MDGTKCCSKRTLRYALVRVSPRMANSDGAVSAVDRGMPQLRLRDPAPERRPVTINAMNRAIASGQSWDLELRLITYLDRSVWVRAMGELEFDAQGKPVQTGRGFPGHHRAPAHRRHASRGNRCD